MCASKCSYGSRVSISATLVALELLQGLGGIDLLDPLLDLLDRLGAGHQVVSSSPSKCVSASSSPIAISPSIGIPKIAPELRSADDGGNVPKACSFCSASAVRAERLPSPQTRITRSPGAGAGLLDRLPVGGLVRVASALARGHVDRALDVPRVEALGVTHVDHDRATVDLVLGGGRQQLLDPALDELERRRHVLAGHLHGVMFIFPNPDRVLQASKSIARCGREPAAHPSNWPPPSSGGIAFGAVRIHRGELLLAHLQRAC